jgi:hypothetical protein
MSFLFFSFAAKGSNSQRNTRPSGHPSGQRKEPREYKIQGQKSLRPLRNLSVLRGFVFSFFYNFKRFLKLIFFLPGS